MPSKIPDGETRGWIVPIGGAENKENDRQILERFVRVSGGSEANIVIIPTASRMHETGPRYEQLFRDLGAADVAVYAMKARAHGREENIQTTTRRISPKQRPAARRARVLA